jgi:hypothetical protein
MIDETKSFSEQLRFADFIAAPYEDDDVHATAVVNYISPQMIDSAARAIRSRRAAIKRRKLPAALRDQFREEAIAALMAGLGAHNAAITKGVWRRG